jgi:hypothetical protein
VTAVDGATVPTVTFTDAGVPPLNCTELGTLHVGGDVTVGLMVQLKFALAVKAKVGVTVKLKLAL